MERVRFGKTDLMVSEMCLGTMMFGDRCDLSESERIVSRALEAGVNFLDTAAMYCDGATEEIVGKILKGRRDEVILATKVHKGIDGRSITTSIDESLKRLQTDYVDLYLIHWPKEGMNPEEIMEALASVVASGKARYVGCCNYPAWLFAYSNRIAVERGWMDSLLVNNQIPYNLVERGVEVEVLPQAVAEDVAITVYRPVLAGLLAGKYRPGEAIPTDSRGQTDERLERWLKRYENGLRTLLAFSEARGLTPGQVAIAWLRASPAVTCPIVGCSSLSQLESNLQAFEVSITEEEREELSQAFGAEVWEEAGGAYKGLRRNLTLTSKSERLKQPA